MASSTEAVAPSTEASPDEQSKRPGLPVPLVRSVVATRRDLDAFGWILATAAWTRGFAAAMRKAFLGDGSEGNWTVWRKHFSDYVPILDFVHALCYVYAAAIAGRNVTAGWSDYCTWAQWLWSGEVAKVILALEQRQQEIGSPADTDSDDSARAVVARTLGKRFRVKNGSWLAIRLGILGSRSRTVLAQRVTSPHSSFYAY